MMADLLPRVAGKLTKNAPLAPLVWFKSGGLAEYLFEPRDIADLQAFLRDLDPGVPVMALGLGSNLIVRDGGVAGVVVRLGKPFARVTLLDPPPPGEVAGALATDGGGGVKPRGGGGGAGGGPRQAPPPPPSCGRYLPQRGRI